MTLNLTVKEVLITTKQRISNEKHWCQGALAQNADGKYIAPQDPRATNFCALGSLIALDIEETTYYQAWDCLITELPGNVRSLSSFNDNSTHKQVLELFDKAIARCGE